MKRSPISNPIPHKLVARMIELGRQERQAIIDRQVRTAVGPSTLRVYAPRTNEDIKGALLRLNLRALKRCKNQEQFRRFFLAALSRVDRALQKRNRDNTKLRRGRKWGHAAKITCLYLRGIVLHTRYFDDDTMQSLKPLLYVPVDSIVFRQLRQCGIRLDSRAINQIDSSAKFWQIQNLLTAVAVCARTPRILLDDVWST